MGVRWNKPRFIVEPHRPPWRDDFKSFLLKDFLRTTYAKKTTIFQLLTAYEPTVLNERGILEALERRHIVPWGDLRQIYAEYANRSLCFVGRPNRRDEHVKEIIEILLGRAYTMELRATLDEVLGRKHGGPRSITLLKEKKADQTAMVAFASRYTFFLNQVNSSMTNVFIGPARKNRKIGAQFDAGTDVPESIVGRPQETLLTHYKAWRNKPEARRLMRGTKTTVDAL